MNTKILQVLFPTVFFVLYYGHGVNVPCNGGPMPRLYYVQNSIIGIILVCIVLFYVLGQGGRRQAQDSLFIALLLTTLSIIFFELLVDSLSGRDFIGSQVVITFVAFFFYVSNSLIGALYLLYLDQLRRRWVRIPRTIGLVAFVPFSIGFLLTFISLFNGMIFSIDAENIYHRGPLFHILTVIAYGSLVLGFVYLVFYRSSFKHKDFSLFLFFPFPIIVGSIVQLKFYGVEIAGVSMAITLLVVYLQQQNSQANKDYLTLLYNRSLSEQYLQHLIHHQKEGRAIGGILMDINSFKQINDTHGHDLGDKVLRYFARLLTDSFGSHWLIARYGGDEFILFKESTSQQGLDTDLARFYEQLERFNAKENFPFPISISLGSSLCGIYDNLDASAFIKILDEIMYKSKRTYYIQKNQGTILPKEPT